MANIEWKPGLKPETYEFLAWAERTNLFADQVFTHTSYHTGVTRHFNCSKMLMAVLQGTIKFEKVAAEVIEETYQRILGHHGVEEGKIRALTDFDMRVPILICKIIENGDSGTDTIVDGNHRIVKGYRAGQRMFMAAVIEEPEWSKFLIHFPEELNPLITEKTDNGQNNSEEARRAREALARSDAAKGRVRKGAGK